MKQHSILLAYDDPHLLKVIGWALEDRGCRVTSVSSADEAIDVLNRKHFDVVLSDLLMNPKEGVSVLRKAKEIDPETMAILLGCKENGGYDQDGIPHEADEYVFTPCGIPKLWKRVANCLERLELSREQLRTEKEINQLTQRISNISRIISHDIRKPLELLSDEMKALKEGSYGKIDDNAASKLNGLCKEFAQLIRKTDDSLKELSASLSSSQNTD